MTNRVVWSLKESRATLLRWLQVTPRLGLRAPHGPTHCCWSDGLLRFKATEPEAHFYIVFTLSLSKSLNDFPKIGKWESNTGVPKWEEGWNKSQLWVQRWKEVAYVVLMLSLWISLFSLPTVLRWFNSVQNKRAGWLYVGGERKCLPMCSTAASVTHIVAEDAEKPTKEDKRWRFKNKIINAVPQTVLF